MQEFMSKYKEIWANSPLELLDEYNYQPILTEKLDKLIVNDFDIAKLHEIILWKTNRYPEIDGDLINEVKKLSTLINGEHKKSKETIHKLLKTKGIALPMASTILRFINPNVFQIIDDRAYRVLFSSAKQYPSKPIKITDRYLNKSTSIYFEYIDKINSITSKKLPFHLADRILYQLDIKLGNKIGAK